MAAEKKRKVTQVGLGAVSGRAPGRPSQFRPTVDESVSGTRDRVSIDMGEADADEGAPLATRDTLPAPPSVPGGAKDSQARRRATVDVGLVRRDTLVDLATQASAASLAPPASTPPEGRYSSKPSEQEVVVPQAPRKAGKETLRRAERQALRVDNVGSTTIVARRDASLSMKARVIDRKRLASAPLAPREAFLVSFVDGVLTVPELVRAAGMPEPEVMAILARLVRLRIVSL